MPVKISSFMGRAGWMARKLFPNLASKAYLKLQFMTRGTDQNDYIRYFLAQEVPPMPQVVNIETINRCNSTCAFCSANKYADRRPFAKISD